MEDDDAKQMVSYLHVYQLDVHQKWENEPTEMAKHLITDERMILSFMWASCYANKLDNMMEWEGWANAGVVLPEQWRRAYADEYFSKRNI